jgi:ABC-type lipoprotein export system ATPase subunit
MLNYAGLIDTFNSVRIRQLNDTVTAIFRSCIIKTDENMYNFIFDESRGDVFGGILTFYKNAYKRNTIFDMPWFTPVVSEKAYVAPICPANFDHLLCVIESGGNKYHMNIDSNVHTPNVFGSVVRISGNNGAGKSTLFNILTDTESWLEYKLHTLITDTITEGFSLSGLKRIHYNQKGDSSLDGGVLTLLGKERGSYRLSPGQRAKFYCSTILMYSKPGTILMFDEPSAPMDKEGKETFWRKLEEVRKDHITFIISHEIPEWFKCDYEIVVRIKLKED